MWKTKPVFHISTPPTATTDKGQKRRYTNIPLGTKDRSGHPYDKRPVGFQNAPWFSSVTVNIGEGEKARKFGYWSWDERNTGPDVPNYVKTQWRDSEVALRPLLHWFHQIEALKLLPSDARSTLCTDEGPEAP